MERRAQKESARENYMRKNTMDQNMENNNMKKRNMKKNTAKALVITGAICLATVGGVSAFLTDYDKATNQFTVGKVDIRRSPIQVPMMLLLIWKYLFL